MPASVSARTSSFHMLSTALFDAVQTDVLTSYVNKLCPNK